jgi:hypothetical protein
MKDLPKLLYRYRPLGRRSDTLESETFRTSSLYFPSRLQFNDPFDCIMPDMSHIRDEEFRDLIRKRAQEEFTELPADERLPHAEEMNKIGRAEIEEILQEFANRLGVLSLSTRPDNSVMWAHYANNQKGMCLEFDTTDKPFLGARPIVYSSTAPKYVLDAHEANAEAFVLTKDIKWSYEEEWRIIASMARRSYPFSPTALQRVIFGSKSSAKNREKVKQWIATGPCRPQFCEIVTRKGSYKLDVVLLS